MAYIKKHPILDINEQEDIIIDYNGQQLKGKKGQSIAALLIGNGIRAFRYTPKKHKPRGVFCGIGQCTDCVMVVNGVPNVKTCVTMAEDGMKVETQDGFEVWRKTE